MSYDPKNQTTQEEQSNAQDARARYEQLQAQSKRLKRRMLVVLGSILCAMLIALGAVLAIDSFGTKTTPMTIPEGTYHFYPKFSGNYEQLIEEHPEYLEKDRYLWYCKSPSGEGLWQGISEENLKDFPLEVRFVYEWLGTIIQGDAHGYNASFTNAYWVANEKEGNLKKTDFSPQMIYDIKLTYRSTSSENGQQRVEYKLEYRIMRNDGSFRRDIGSDMSREQYVTVRLLDDETALIDRLVTVYPAQKTEKVEVLPVLIGVILASAGAALAVVIVKTVRKKKVARVEESAQNQEGENESD